MDRTNMIKTWNDVHLGDGHWLTEKIFRPKEN